jgi:hypothetical protein
MTNKTEQSNGASLTNLLWSVIGTIALVISGVFWTLLWVSSEPESNGPQIGVSRSAAKESR